MAVAQDGNELVAGLLAKLLRNSADNDTVEVFNPSLDVQKITINRTVNVGEQVMFEIVVHNTGKVILNDVTVRENSFDGLTYDSFIDYYGVWTKNGDLSWTLNAPLYAGERDRTYEGNRAAHVSGCPRR